MKVALVHDYLVDRGGAERVLEVICEAFPDAPIFTSVYNPESTFKFFREKDVRVSFLQKITNKKGMYKMLLPLYPLAFEQFDFSGYDVVLSSTTSFAKGVITPPETCHICYCNTPARFLWRYHDYVKRGDASAVTKLMLPIVAKSLRSWDYNAAQRVDYFVSGSFNSARRIKKFYRRDSLTMHSPIDASKFRIADKPGDYYLIVSRLVPYKRIDVAIEAFNRLGLPLYIIGGGPDRKRLASLAGANVKFLGRMNDADLADYYSRCRALVFPGEEDFGLTPLEANASGRPVVAYAAGGALETVIDGVTGKFFYEPNPEALMEVIKEFDASSFKPEILRGHAIRFDKEIFKRKIIAFVEEKRKSHGRGLAGERSVRDVFERTFTS